MGASQSNIATTKCQSEYPNTTEPSKERKNDLNPLLEAPPTMVQPQSFDQKLFDKFTKQPLVPLGCMATAYFLVSGIKSFKNREPRRAQKMMRARVGAQFATLIAFVGYMGVGSFNLEVAPRYQRYQEHKADLADPKENEEQSS